MVSRTLGARSRICAAVRSTAPPSSSRAADFGDERTQTLEHAVGNTVPAAEGDPFDREAALTQKIAQILPTCERQDRIRSAVALKHPESGSLRRERAPFGLGDGCAAHQDEPGGWARRSQGHVAGEHGALRKSSEHDALARRRELRLAGVEKSFDCGARFGHAGWRW